LEYSTHVHLVNFVSDVSYDEMNDLSFLIVSFPFICSNVFHQQLYIELIYICLYDIPERLVSIIISFIDGCC